MPQEPVQGNKDPNKQLDLSLLCEFDEECTVGRPRAHSGEESADAGDARDTGSMPGLRRSPGGGKGKPLQYSCLGSPMGRGACQATVHGATKSWTGLSTHTRFGETR